MQTMTTARSARPGPRLVSEPAAAALHLPPGYHLDLPRRGTTFFREVSGPPGAPTLVLLHGWMASAGLNWFQAFGPLGQHFRVIAPDLRGHGRGLRSRQRFTIARCADDLAETLVELDTGPVIVAGYSMGGPVAQTFWRRHRDLAEGLVLAATSPGFLPVYHERIVFQTVMAAAAVGTRFGRVLRNGPMLTRRLLPISLPDLPQPAQAWAGAEFRRHDTVQVIEAGLAIGTYSSRRWLHEIDVPTGVVITAADRAVPPHLQLNMAESIPGASEHVIDGGHLSCADPRFGEEMLTACLAVSERASRWQDTNS